MASNIIIKRRIELWQMGICAAMCGYLLLGVATESVRSYHWFMLLAIPVIFLKAETGRRFFLDWIPLIAFWLIYDRLRLLQPLLLGRIAVEYPYDLERLAFGWMSGGEVPALASRIWLAEHVGSAFWATVALAAQLVYFSHLLLFPLLMLMWWHRGGSNANTRERFSRHVRAFTAMHVIALLVYIILPVAPPWWVGLHGMAQPSAELVAGTNMAIAMDGAIVQRLIKTAPHWFAAVPSLHGAYPVLLVLLALGERNRLWIAAIAIYGAAMWVATVILNQHYIIDLIAGALLALVAWWFFGRKNRQKPTKDQKPDKLATEVTEITEAM